LQAGTAERLGDASELVQHQRFMREALALAAQAIGRTSPNPAVGALVVAGGTVVGRGYHHRAGEPHAEVLALAEAGVRAAGATLYVTLEPCSHTGRTPPCAPLVAGAGLAHVIVAMEDPNPLVSGSGLRLLSERGLDVRTGVLEDDARSLNEGFIKRITTGLPFVELKVAMTLDGKIATDRGGSRWITGERAREWVHRRRDRCDAILTGAGTVRLDDPQLTVRLPEHDGRQPLRAVVTASGELDGGAAIFHQPAGRTVVFAPEGAVLPALPGASTEVVHLPPRGGGVDLGDPLRWLAEHGVNDVLVEGGAALNAALLKAGLVDRLSAFVAPKLFGGQSAPSAFGDLSVGEPDQAVQLADLEVTRVDEDWLFRGRPIVHGGHC